MNKEVYFVGAGVSLNAPTNIPTGYTIVEEIFKHLSPSIHYRGKLLELANSGRKYKKNPHDYIRFELLFEVIRMYADEKLNVLKFIDSYETPNILHFSLAEKAINNCIVITTNFDCLIEKAIIKLGFEPISICSDSDFRSWESFKSEGFIPVFKIHGSFRRYHGEKYKNVSNTIMATLDKISSNVQYLSLSKAKDSFLTKTTCNKEIVVAGYSGSDDFDIIPTFKKIQFEQLTWIEHTNGVERRNITKRILDDLTQIPSEQLSQKEDFFIERRDEISIFQINTEKYFSELVLDKKIFSLVRNEPTTGLNLPSFVSFWSSDYLSESVKYACAAEIFRRLNRKLEAVNCVKKSLRFSNDNENFQSKILLCQLLISDGRTLKIKTALIVLSEIVAELEYHKDRVEYSEALHLIGFIKSKNGEFNLAIDFFERAINNAIEFQHRTVASNAYHDKALVLTDIGKLTEANDLYRKSLNISSSCGDIKHVTWSLYHLACNHFDSSNFKLSLKYLNQAIEISHLLSDYAHLSNLHHLIGQIEHLKGNYYLGIDNFKKSLDYDTSIGNTEYVSMTWQHIGVIWLDLKKYDQAERCFEEAQKLYNKHADKIGLIELFCYWCWLKIETKCEEEAREKINQAILFLDSFESLQYSVRVKLMKAILDHKGGLINSFERIENEIKSSDSKLVLYDMVYLVCRLELRKSLLSKASISETRKFLKKIGNSVRLETIGRRF